MKHYSKRVREQAALICAIAASTPIWNYGTIVREIGIAPDGASSVLAIAAWKAIPNYSPTDPTRDAEAEALIRTGWSPS